MTSTDTISANLLLINQRIFSARERAGRVEDQIQLIAVTKYAEIGWVQCLIQLGQTVLGESRPQQLSERSAVLGESVQWHMIGHLQRNKVRPVLETGAIIHSVDSERLLDRIELIAAELNITVQVFLEVNISGEESKHGFDPEEVGKLVSRLRELKQTRLLGLMTMAPHSENPEDARPCFRQLRDLQTVLNQSFSPERQLTCLSMGMSGDFEVAIEEGATHIRIGSALFEGLESD